MSVLTVSFEAIGTKWVIDLADTKFATGTRDIERLILEEVDDFDKIYSRFRKDSLVTQISKKPGKFKFPKSADPMFKLYEKLYFISNDLFTPLIGSLMVEAGYDTDYSLIPKTLRKIKIWEDSFIYRNQTLETRVPIQLDFGALGKGHLIDILGELLEKNNIKSYTIDAGGDILHKTDTKKALKVGLENPANTNQVIGVAEIHNESLCASAGNRRAWSKYHHILNPKSKSSPKDVLATWVIAKKAIISDALATALYLVPPDKLTSEFDFGYAILYPGKLLKKSKNFPARIFYG